MTYTAADGSADTQAGSHPEAITTTLSFNTAEDPVQKQQLPVGDLRDLLANFAPGLLADRNAAAQCTITEFRPAGGGEPECARATVVGFSQTELPQLGTFHDSRVYNLVPPPGVIARLGFAPLGLAVTIDLGLSQEPPYNGFARISNLPQVYPIFSSELTLWGVPAAASHDAQRGGPVDGEKRPFLTLPTACTGPLPSTFALTSWQGDLFEQTIESHGDGGEPLGMTGCEALPFNPSITAAPTSRATTSPSGLDFAIDAGSGGLSNPTGDAASAIRETIVTLPEGFSVNPSQAEGLAVCSESDLARETISAAPGQGCPGASKIGTLEVESPLLQGELLKGSLFVAAPYENPFHSLLALYIVIKDPDLGILVKQPLEVRPDPRTGQLTTIARDEPQLPVSHFRLHFFEGARSPLVTPPACGTYQAAAELVPWSGTPPVTATSSFELISGPGGSPCPSAGLPPFHPQLLAGTANNAAGAFSPFEVKITRSDAEQEITHFSIKLPPGVAARLAGVPFCSEAQIAQAASRTGPHGGAEELADPSCPAASRVGTTLAGAGVGPSLTYAPGAIYLAGPYHGAPVSLVAITSGVVGPFDIGTVLVRLAVKVDPETGEVFLDSTGSDPIPHIIEGIPVHLRDIRSFTDRPSFTFNPTSCEPTSTSATVLGAGLDFASAVDDNPFVSTSPFQAADCAALPFRPKLTFQLKGSTKRAGNPALHAHLQMNGFGEAGLAYTRVTLPKTLFLDNAHIGTVCTRVQFRQGAVEGEKCPAGSVIGSAKAVTPVLDAPLEGPIYLRSNPERKLPDIAASLHGQEISVVAVGHTDSAKGGGLRNTFEVIPDAPISSVDINLLGGNRGLIESSRNLCSYKPRARVEFKGHNGKTFNPTIPLKASGCKKHPKSNKSGSARRHGVRATH